MNPEKIIDSFLEVLKTRPHLFSEQVTAALKILEEKIVAAENESNQTISKMLSDWCCNYPEITEAVKDIKKSKPKLQARQPQKDENIVENQFPRRFLLLIQSLEKRISDTPKN